MLPAGPKGPNRRSGGKRTDNGRKPIHAQAVVFLAALGAVLGLAALPASADGHPRKTGSLSVVHGIPDLPVDVYIERRRVAPSVSFGTLATLEPAPGTIGGHPGRRCRRSTAGAPSRPSGSSPTSAKSFVAYLNADGEPDSVDVFYDNVTKNQTGRPS